MASLPALNPAEPYDLIFIDAQKSGYPSYLTHILRMSQPGSSKRLLRAGGLVVADNVLRRAIIADDSDDNPWAKEERQLQSEFSTNTDIRDLREFNRMMVSSERLETFLMPLYDGVGIGRLVN
jgi:predicted O-methyltransferase YrrM